MNNERGCFMRKRMFGLLCMFMLGIFAFQGWGASAPSAAFTYSPTAPLVKKSIQFTDSSTGAPISWYWTFGDGKTSSTKNPTHIYSVAGTFKVTLKAVNKRGSNTITKTLVVKASGVAPKASFTFTPNAPLTSQTVTFTDTSTGSPTSWTWAFGDGITSTLQKPTHSYSKTGTFKVTLTVKNAYGSNSISRSLVVKSTAFTIDQTISDVAQRTTLAFSGLAMMTGNLQSQSFFPPGKLADYTGFQYLRDNDPDKMGHNTSFLTRVANNIIYILNDAQFAQLKALATSQIDQINLYGYKRFALMKAFRRVLDDDIPSGSSGLNLNAVKEASKALYLLDGQISFDRAYLYATILDSMDSTQIAYLDAMKGKGFNSWPNITNDQIKSKMTGLAQGTGVAVMTYASDLFSWYVGSVEADVYFCPERHGTYFGSFYIKDAPAVGHEGYSISEQLTATAGAALCDSSKGYVTQDQATVISSLVDTQRYNLYAGTTNIVTIRTQIATLLRSLMASTAYSDSVKTQVLELSEIYGELDGENNYHYATIFAQVYDTLSTDQKTKLAALRKSIMSGKYSDGTPFDYSSCSTYFLFSSAITNLELLSPYIGDTDYLFFEP
ncbi:MAG: PKD domain-containing protein [Candidatus Omnitrophota bacterium]